MSSASDTTDFTRTVGKIPINQANVEYTSSAIFEIYGLKVEYREPHTQWNCQLDHVFFEVSLENVNCSFYSISHTTV